MFGIDGHSAVWLWSLSHRGAHPCRNIPACAPIGGSHLHEKCQIFSFFYMILHGPSGAIQSLYQMWKKAKPYLKIKRQTNIKNHPHIFFHANVQVWEYSLHKQAYKNKITEFLFGFQTNNFPKRYVVVHSLKRNRMCYSPFPISFCSSDTFLCFAIFTRQNYRLLIHRWCLWPRILTLESLRCQKLGWNARIPVLVWCHKSSWVKSIQGLMPFYRFGYSFSRRFKQGRRLYWPWASILLVTIST